MYAAAARKESHMPVLLKRFQVLILASLLILSSSCSQETNSVSGTKSRPVSSRSDSNTEGSIRGNKRSMIYHWPGCRNYDDIAPHNRVPFNSRADAEKAGYRAARNCS